MEDPDHSQHSARSANKDPAPPDDPIARSEEALGVPTAEEVEDSIAQGILSIHENSYGTSAGRAHSHLVGDTLVVILDDLELLPSEEVLIAHGRQDAVLEVRTRFQQTIKDAFRAAVERATGRKVTAFLSNTHLDEPRFAVEIFRLEPQQES